VPRPITDIFPRPTALTLAGGTYLVGPLRLAEIADLQHWLDGRHDPLAEVRPFLDAAEVAPEHRHLFDAAIDRAEEGPILWGTARGDAELATAEGILEFLCVALRRYQPDMTRDQVLDVGERMTWGEYASLRLAASRPDPVVILGHALDRLAGVTRPTDPRPPRWGELVDRVARSHGMTYEDIEGLTLDQLVNRLHDGKVPEGGRPLAPGEDIDETARRREAWLAGANSTKGAG
jgi:hypothetical protein